MSFLAGVLMRRSADFPLGGSSEVYLLVICSNRRRKEDGDVNEEDAHCVSQSDMLQFIGEEAFKWTFVFLISYLFAVI